MNVWICNTCSISSKTDNSARRKDYLINLIKGAWPDIVILLETNHSNDPNILCEYYDNFFTSPNINKGVIILTKKLLGCEQIGMLEDRILVVKSRIIPKFTIIGAYCPYYNLQLSTIDFIKKFQKSNWFIGADLESFGKNIISQLETGFWGKIDYTRETDNCKTQTEFAGFFYEAPIMTRLEKVCDHYMIKCEISTKWDGVQITFPAQISRKKAICTINNYDSKATAELLADWPTLPFKLVVFGLIPVVPRTIRIFRNNITLNDIGNEISTRYRAQKREKMLLQLKKDLVYNDLKSVANITAKIMHIPRKSKSTLSVLGILNASGKILIGEDSISEIKNFYEKLFNAKSLSDIKQMKNLDKSIKFDNELFEKALILLGKKKAMGWDEMPDEILKFKYVKNKLKSEFIKMLNTTNIPAYLKFGRLCLLSKEKGNVFPRIENTRPIVILSPVYKLLEIYWLFGVKDLIWSHIGIHQTGFKPHGSTQFNICNMKKWMRDTRKFLILFVDIQKAYDHVIREKLYDIMSKIGIPSEYLNFYITLTTEMRIYFNNSEFINYSRGVPQGSCISPILFNLYFEEGIKNISPYSDLLLSFADDVACGLQNSSKLEKIQEMLKLWEQDLNLLVHNRKTECLLFYLEKPLKLTFPICEFFKYLGIEIYNKKSQFTKTFIVKQITELAKKIKSLSFNSCQLKIKKFNIMWWYISILLYKQFSNVYLKLISLPDFTKTAIIKIKYLLGIHKAVKQKFVSNLLNIDLERTLTHMIIKFRKYCPFEILKSNCPNPVIDSESEKAYIESSRFWNYILSDLDLDINSLYVIFERTWWVKNEGKYKCKSCNKDLSLFHLYEFHQKDYPFTCTIEFEWIKEIEETFNFPGSLIKRKIDKENGSAFIKHVYNEAILCKQEAIKNIGLLFKKEPSLNQKIKKLGNEKRRKGMNREQKRSKITNKNADIMPRRNKTKKEKDGKKTNVEIIIN